VAAEGVPAEQLAAARAAMMARARPPRFIPLIVGS
jgi:hypothetical protein